MEMEGPCSFYPSVQQWGLRTRLSLIISSGGFGCGYGDAPASSPHESARIAGSEPRTVIGRGSSSCV
jgi:hypothetical protein